MPELTLEQRLIKRQAQLESDRKPWEALWREIETYVVPIRRSDQYGDPERHRGAQRGTEIYDGTALTALELFAEGLHGYLISPAIQWFRLRMRETWMGDMPEVKLWLQEVEYRMYMALQRSNFYSSMAEYFLDAGSIGTADLYVDEDLSTGKLVFNAIHPKECYLAENQHGEVTENFRRLKLQAHQAWEKFEELGVQDQLSDQLKRTMETNPYEKFEFLHAIFPRTDRDADLLNNKNKPYASCWIELTGEKKLIYESGFSRMPHCVWRYKKATGEVYGRSPATAALTDIKGLNTLSKTLLGAAQLAVEPAYNVPAELMGKVRIVARGMNYYSEPERIISPIQQTANYPIGIEREDQKRQIIEEHFKVDFFLMLARAERQMTATEIIERQGEKAAVLGTSIGRLNSECLNPVIDTVFDLEMAAGRLPPPPDVLYEQGADIDVEYMGPLAQAQRRLFKSQGITRGLEAITPVISIEPQVRDNIDWDTVARELLEAFDFPQAAIKTPDVVQAIRQARAQAVQQRSNQEGMESLTGSIKQMAEADKASGGSISAGMEEALEVGA